ncbi:MAG: sulfatase-like hydrolase/transferase [Eubacteriales bacterium]|nr:sulfatase-like hydrolase/transferase [Eubacteriales bacterium]
MESQYKSKIKKLFCIAACILGCMLICVMPLISFVAFESITGCLPTINSQALKLNLLFYYGFYFLVIGIFLLISGTTGFAAAVSALLLFALGMAEYFTEMYSGHPITIHNFTALNTLNEVIGAYSFEFTDEMRKWGIITVVLALLSILLPVRVKKIFPRAAFSAVLIIAAIAMPASYFLYFIPTYTISFNKWDGALTYEDQGFMCATGLSVYYSHISKPKSYSKEKLEEICRNIRENYAAEDGSTKETKPAFAVQTPVNVLLIMNESLSELSVAGDFAVNEEYFPYLNSLYESGQADHGYLYVPVFGSGTSMTEFEVLMSDSAALLPYNINPYRDFVSAGTGSLVSSMKAAGYRTLAMHPMQGENWERDKAYANMGFDEFLDYSYYEPGAEYLGNFVSDRYDYKCLLDQINNKNAADDKLFIFNVTIQNHGGYGLDIEEAPNIRLTGELAGKYPFADRYLSLMKASDDAVRYLFESLEEIDEPTMVVIFGDHQPSVEDEFYDEIAGKPASEATPEERMMWYQTPYLIWKNYEDGNAEAGYGPEDLSAVYLSTVLLDEAGIPGSGYNTFLRMLRRAFPVIQTNAVIDRDGRLYSWEEALDPAVCPYADILNQYYMLVYDHLAAHNSDIF